MMDLYKILGIDRKACASDIKTAFRKRSSTAHPDKGGTDTEMAAVNKAYMVLSDPDRRAKYDATGQEDAEPGLEQQARSFLLQAFSEALNYGDIDSVRFAGRKLTTERSKAGAAQGEMERAAKKLRERRGKVIAKTGDNLMHAIIDQQLADIDRQRTGIARAFEVFDRAEAMLGEYESTEAPPPAPAEHIDWMRGHFDQMRNVAGR